jgi:hypothetical protein
MCTHGGNIMCLSYPGEGSSPHLEARSRVDIPVGLEDGPLCGNAVGAELYSPTGCAGKFLIIIRLYDRVHSTCLGAQPKYR